MKKLSQARRDFKKSCVCKNGTILPKLRLAVKGIFEYKSPLKLKEWHYSGWSSWGYQLKNKKLYEYTLYLLNIMGSPYEITNDSRSGRNAADDIIEISSRGLIRARTILKDYVNVETNTAETT